MFLCPVYLPVPCRESVMVLTVIGGLTQRELEHHSPPLTVFTPDPVPVQSEHLHRTMWGCHKQQEILWEQLTLF